MNLPALKDIKLGPFLLKVLPWFVGIWLGVAVLGYEIAVMKYKASLPVAKPSPVAERDAFQSADGALAWVQADAARIRGARMQLAGDGRTFRLPPQYVVRPEGWPLIDQYLKVGVKAHIVFDEQNLIVALYLYPGPNGDEQAVVLSADSEKIRAQELAANKGQKKTETTDADVAGLMAVSWSTTVGVNATGDGSGLTKTAAEGWGNAFAKSNQTVGNSIIFTTDGHNNIFGITDHDDGSQSFTTIRYGIQVQNNNTWTVYENGHPASNGSGKNTPSDIWKISLAGGAVTYFKNGTVLYRSTLSPKKRRLFPYVAAFFSGETVINSAGVTPGLAAPESVEPPATARLAPPPKPGAHFNVRPAPPRFTR